MVMLSRYPFFVLILSVTLILIGCSDGGEKGTPEITEPKAPVRQLSLETIRAPSLGPENAPVVVYEVSNFTWPFCKKVGPIFKTLLAEYEGRIRFVYVPYVKVVSKRSKNSALAAYAAWDQGKFWEMHDLLFERAPDIEDKAIIKLAEELGLDKEKFTESMKSDRNTMEIEKINDLLWKMGYDKTPTVIINGEVLSGARNYNQYRSAIEKALVEAERR